MCAQYLPSPRSAGAAMVLFEFPCGQRVLHTGDFRYDEQAIVGRSKTLQRLLQEFNASSGSNVARPLNNSLCIYLDTTYCGVEHTFPSQAASIAAILDCIRKEIRDSHTSILGASVKGVGAMVKAGKKLITSLGAKMMQSIFRAASQGGIEEGKPPAHEVTVTEVEAGDSSTADSAGAGVAEVTNDEDILFVFGAYQIGKERVFLSAAELLQCNVRVDLTRKRVMSCYEQGWNAQSTAAVSELLTTDPAESNVWVESMFNVSLKKLDALRLEREKATGRPCKKVVGFVPTGWSHGSGRPGRSKGTGGASAASAAVVPNLNTNGQYQASADVKIQEHRNKRGDVLYSIPYSEHSSFPELLQFLRSFRPLRVIPTVGTTAAHVQKQLLLLRDSAGIYKGGAGGGSSAPAPAPALNSTSASVRQLSLGSAVTVTEEGNLVDTDASAAHIDSYMGAFDVWNGHTSSHAYAADGPSETYEPEFYAPNGRKRKSEFG